MQELLADLDTPLSLYLKLANRPFSYLLESVVGGERFGRYSFIGLPCRDYIKVSGSRTEIYQDHRLVQTHHGNPLHIIEQYHAQFKTPDIPGLPRFTGGLVGYFGYESIYHFEHIAHRLRQPEKHNPLNTPDILLMLSQELAVVDNLSGKIHLIVYADPSHPQGYETARAKLESLREKLRQSVAIPLSLGSRRTVPQHLTGEETFKSYVRRVREYILNGDCMQVVPAQSMKLPFTDHPLHLYRALRTLNPSPYLFYYDFGDFHIVGSSPEILVRRERDKVVVRPIAGTRLRGATPEQDLANERAQRRGAHQPNRQSRRNRQNGGGKIFACDAHRFQRGRQPETRHQQHGHPRRYLPRRHALGRAQSARAGNHRRAGNHQAQHFRRCGGRVGL